MIWILGIVALIVVIALISAIGRSGDQVAAAQASAEWERRMASRVAAYRDYLRREGDDDWQKMSDNELDDLIENAIRLFARDIQEARSLAKLAFWVTGAAVTICGVVYLESLQSYVKDMSPLVFMSLWMIAVLGSGYAMSRIVGAWRVKAVENRWSRGWEVDKLIV